MYMVEIDNAINCILYTKDSLTDPEHSIKMKFGFSNICLELSVVIWTIYSILVIFVTIFYTYFQQKFFFFKITWTDCASM